MGWRLLLEKAWLPPSGHLRATAVVVFSGDADEVEFNQKQRLGMRQTACCVNNAAVPLWVMQGAIM